MTDNMKASLIAIGITALILCGALWYGYEPIHKTELIEETPIGAADTIAFDAAGNSGTTYWPSPTSNSTLSFTTSGTNRVLLVGVATYIHTGDSAVTADSVTYNSVSMTKIASIAGLADSEGAYQETSLWQLVAPATGSNSISVTLSGSAPYSEISAISYTGVDQTNPIDSYNTGQSGSSGGDPTTSIVLSDTVVGSNRWLVGYIWSRGGTPAVVTGTTQRTANAALFSTIGDSNGTVSTGSQSLSWTTVSGDWPGGVIAAIAPVAPTDTCTPVLDGLWAMDLQDHCTTTDSVYSDYGMECYNTVGGSWVIANGAEVRVASSTNCIPQIEATGVFSIQPSQ